MSILRIQQIKEKTMKQIILSAFLVSLIFTGYGQKHFRLSFVASPSVNWMNTNNPKAESGKPVLGYDFGLCSDMYMTEDERYSISTGLQISNVGGEMTYRPGANGFQFAEANLPNSTKIHYRLRYIEIPVALKLKTDQFRRIRYWGQFGLSPMLNIQAQGDSNDGTLKKTNINTEVNMFNLAMNVGAGFDFDLGGNNSVTTGLVFQNGLIDVTTDNAFTDKTIINSLKLKIGLIF